MCVAYSVPGAEDSALHQLAMVPLGESHDFRNFSMARLALRPILEEVEVFMVAISSGEGRSKVVLICEGCGTLFQT